MSGKRKSHIVMWVAVLALALVTVGGTLALMAVPSSSLVNRFTVASVDTEIHETMNGQGDKQVSIKNNGPSDAYVRARIMVSGVKDGQVQIVKSAPTGDGIEEHKVYLVMPKSTTWQQATGETEKDDFYYYLGVLPPKGGETDNLLTEVVFGSDLKNDQKFLAGFNITVYHESVLAINKPEQPNGTVDLNMVTKSFEAASAANAGTP